MALSNLNAKTKQMHSGGNHSYSITRDNYVEIGQAIYDSARGQYAFVATDHDLVLTSAEKTSIVAILNGLSQ